MQSGDLTALDLLLVLLIGVSVTAVSAHMHTRLVCVDVDLGVALHTAPDAADVTVAHSGAVHIVDGALGNEVDGSLRHRLSGEVNTIEARTSHGVLTRALGGGPGFLTVGGLLLLQSGLVLAVENVHVVDSGRSLTLSERDARAHAQASSVAGS